MIKIMKNIIGGMLSLSICFLVSSCTSYDHSFNFKMMPKNYSSVQVDIAGVNDKEYKKLKDIAFDSYWKFAFANKSFPKDKMTVYFDKNLPTKKHVSIQSKILEKWKNKNSKYLMLFAYLPDMPKNESSTNHKNTWKLTIPIKFTYWLWIYDNKVWDIGISHDKITITE